MKGIRLCLLVLALLLAISSGCVHVNSVNLERMPKGGFLLPPASGEPLSSEPVEVVILAPDELACFHVVVQDQVERTQRGPYRCESFFTTPDAVESEIRSRSEQAEHGMGKGNGNHFLGFSEVLRNRLDAHLNTHFHSVTVSVVSDRSSEADAVVVPDLVFYTGAHRFAAFHALLELDIEVGEEEGGKLAAESAHAMPTTHLAWAVPVFVLTFPIGVIITNLAFNNLQLQASELSVAEAIDEAAAEAARMIAAQVKGRHDSAAVAPENEDVPSLE